MRKINGTAHNWESNINHNNVRSTITVNYSEICNTNKLEPNQRTADEGS